MRGRGFGDTGPGLRWRVGLVGACFVVSLIQSERVARAVERAVEEPARWAHDACPSLFGTVKVRRENAARRRRLLRSIEAAPHLTTIVHSGNWTTPAPMQVQGIRFKSEEGAVLAELDYALSSRFDCAKGTFRVAVDDALGADTRVVGLLDDTLLIEREGALRALTIEGHEPRHFSVGWAAPWKFNPYLDRARRRAAKPPPRRR